MFLSLARLTPVLVIILHGSIASAQLIPNGGFETGFVWWQRAGAATPVSVACTEGTSCAYVTTCNPIEKIGCYNVADLPVDSSAVNVTTGASLSGVEGSAICHDVYATGYVNTLIRADVMILTEELNAGTGNDFAFVTINGDERVHFDVSSTTFDGVVPAPLLSYFHHATPWLSVETCIFEPTILDSCAGVMDTGDGYSPTAILVDNVRFATTGANGCPGYTYAHDDVLVSTVQEDATLDIPALWLTYNDADETSSIVEVNDAYCAGIPATVWIGGGGGVSFVPPTDFPALPPAANTCGFDYVIQGPTSPNDPTLVTSEAHVEGITVLWGQPCGPGCLEADVPSISTWLSGSPAQTLEDLPVSLEIEAWSNDDDDSEHVYLEVLLSEGSLIGPAVPDDDPTHCGGQTPIDIEGGGWACPLANTTCTTMTSLPLQYPPPSGGFPECGPGDDLDPTVWIVNEDDIPQMHYLPVTNRANVMMDQSCPGSVPFPCSSSGAPITIDVDVVVFEEMAPDARNRASLPDTIDVLVGEKPDAPNVSASDAIGVEDSWMPLTLSASITDDDLSEVMSLQVTGVPSTAELNMGTNVGGGTWSLNPGDLPGLAIQYTGNPDHRDDNISLTLVATSTEVLSNQYSGYDPSTQNPQATTLAPFTVTVNGVADQPTVTAADAAGNEDGSIPLTISPALTDTDGSEVLTVVIDNVPTGVVFSAGVEIAAGEWAFTAAEIAGGVNVTPLLHSDLDLALRATAYATEQTGQCGSAPGGGGAECTSDTDCSASTCLFDFATAEDTFSVRVDAVADTPTLYAGDATGAVNAAIPLTLSVGLVDDDGSETLTAEISGVEGILSAGTDQDGGVWSLVPSDFAGLTLTSTTPVDATFTLTVTATETGAENDVATLTASSSGTFDVLILPVNQAPSFDAGPNQIVAEDAGPQTVTGWATNIQPGPAEESSQTVTFELSTDNDALFATLPAVSSTGVLTYTAVAETSGQAVVTIVAHDDGGTAVGGVDTSAPQTFTITVTSVNDPPVFVTPSPFSPITAPAGTAMTFTVVATDADGDTVTLSATGVPDGATFTAASGVLAWTPEHRQAGVHTMVVTATDGRVSVDLTVTITVTWDDNDNDGVPDDLEVAWGLSPNSNDSDSDGIDDSTEVGDDWDNPINTDGDTAIDALDTDSDDDSIPDADEAGDTDRATPPVDTDQDGTPDFRDTDSDDDTVGDAIDNCRLVANADQADGNRNGEGDACDGWTAPEPAGGCDCRSTPGGGLALASLGLFALGWARKRRRPLASN